MPFSNDELISVRKKSKSKTLVLIISFGLFIISLFNTSYCTESGSCNVAYETLLIGWLGMLYLGAGLTWIANPLIFISWILIVKNKRFAWIPSLVACVTSIMFLKFNSIVINEAGHYSKITFVGSGFYLWTSSCFVSFIGSLLIKFLVKGKSIKVKFLWPLHNISPQNYNKSFCILFLTTVL